MSSLNLAAFLSGGRSWLDAMHCSGGDTAFILGLFSFNDSFHLFVFPLCI